MADAIQERFPFEQTLGWLPSTHEGDDVLHALLEAMTAEFAERHQDVLDLQGGMILAEATGWHLEQWGLRLGEPRGDVTDAEYRRFIRARLLTIQSSAELERLLDIVRLLLDTEDVKWVRVGPHQVGFYAYCEGYHSTALNARALEQVTSATAAGDIVSPLAVVPEGYFGFDEDPDAEPWGVGLWAEAA